MAISWDMFLTDRSDGDFQGEASPDGPVPPDLPDPGSLRRGFSPAALALSLPLQAAFAFVLLTWNPWAGRVLRAGTGRVLSVALGPERMPVLPVPAAAPPPQRALVPPAPFDNQGPGPVPDPGGSRGSRMAAPAFADPLRGLPDPSGLASLADMPATPAAPPAATTLALPAHPLAGGGYGRGSGTGEGDGTGPGKGGWARRAAELKPLEPDDFQVLTMVSPRYVIKESERHLRNSVVVVKLLLDTEGVPLHVEALSGPPVLVPPTLEAAKAWRFRLAGRVKAQAPVVVVIRYRWIMA